MKKSIFNLKSNTSWYFIDPNYMVLHRQRWIDDGFGQGDALWRTSFAYIAYGRNELLKGILSCFGDKIVMRYPGYDGRDTSRDQLTAAYVAFALNDKVDLIHEYGPKFRKKISEKFNTTLDMRWWIDALMGSKFKAKLFSLISFYQILGILWTKFLYKIIGIKFVAQEEYKEYDTDGLKKIHKLRNLRYPSYALHLFAWQLYTCPDNSIKRFLMRCIQPLIVKENILLRLLFGGKVLRSDIMEYIPMNEISWQDELVKPNYSALKKLYPVQYQENAVDNDLLWWYVKLHPEQMIS